MGKINSLIESIGVYLPPKTVSTDEVLRACKNKVRFPLQHLTGIKVRRMAGEDEFSVDLAKKATADCLDNSRYRPRDIDLLICCNISRYDGPDFRFSFEPNTSIKLKHCFGFDNALVFDITNACAGMFTAVSIVDAFIKAGRIRRGMVVSGEYISHLTLTAQKEISEYLDSRLACLTLGDAGAAMILEEAPDDGVGFHEIDLYTLGRYSSYCVAQATKQEHGGAIMVTDALKLSAVGIKQAVAHSVHILKRGGWSPDAVQHLIMHQTTERVLRDAVREINKHYARKVCHEGNVIVNLAERGNTATASHVVALMDNILNNRINAGDKVVFSVTASGLTTGTVLYTFDDLPDRLRRNQSNGGSTPKIDAEPARTPALPPRSVKVRVESIGLIPQGGHTTRDSIELAKIAALDCLGKSKYDRGDIELLMCAGVYRNNGISEPAIAAILAGEVGINDAIESQEQNKCFAFDLFNGALGFLSACHTAIQMIEARVYDNALIVASEIENNAEVAPDTLRGLKETGSAMILEPSADSGTGFGNFVFKDFTEHLDDFVTYARHTHGTTYLHIEKNAETEIEEVYLKCIPAAVEELLAAEGLDISLVRMIFPPQISSAFVTRLSRALGVTKDKFVDIADDGQDYFTSSLPYALQFAVERNLVGAGDVGLIINVATGVQVGCAVYYF
jgi:3-oxoacyl-[acyl-carrier-protein] synthase III